MRTLPLKTIGTGRAALASLALLTVLALPGAQAADLNCSGTVVGRTIDGDVRVSPGARCVLKDVSVNGSVFLGQNSNTVIVNSTVGGNITGENFQSLRLKSGVTKRQVTLTGGQGVTIAEMRIDGGITLKNTRGGASVSAVSLKGDLICEGNRRINGGGNQIDGKRTGGCSRL